MPVAPRIARRTPRGRRWASAPLVALLALVAITAGRASGAGAADPRRYVIQPEASEVGFKATSRLMNADGRFHRVRGEVVVDPSDPSTARVSVTIDANSIDTGIGLRDSHLRSGDFLDADRHPDIAFESVRVEAVGRRATVTGRLTVRGVTREISVPIDLTLSEVALVATGELVVNRRDYGMDYNSAINPIGNEVRVSFTFRARAS